MAEEDNLYVPESPLIVSEATPETLRSMIEWLMREHLRISLTFEQGVVRHVEFLNAAPVRPREGMTIGADGTNWDPGSGQGVYTYYNSTWNNLGVGPNPGWRDILGTITTRGVGATDPAWAAIGGSVMSAYQFALNDVCWISYHLPHDYALGTDVHFHVHWLADGTDANTVKWQFDYMYADGHDQQAFPVASLSQTTAEQASDTQYKHMVTESAAVTISSMEPDGIIYVKTTRIANGATDNADGIFVLQMDVHYQSTNMSTKNRAPNFYT